VGEVLARGRQAVEPWYLAYLLVGTATGGVAPIFMPLVVSGAGAATQVGIVMAAVGLGGLTAALWGDLADRQRWHRGLFGIGAVSAALALAGFGTTTSLPTWIALALLLGMGTAAANTVATLFVVEAHPRPQWDRRIGWLQTFYNAGIVAGLVLSGSLTHLPLQIGLLAGAAALGAAGLVGWAFTRTPPRPGTAGGAPAAITPRQRRDALAHLHLHTPHVEWVHLSPLRLVHAPRRATLAHLGTAMRSPFGLFLVVWVVCNLGTNAVFTLYPLVVQNVYGITPGPASFALAAATGIGLASYSPASLLTHRLGGVRVLQAALGARVVTFVVLIALAGTAFGGREAVVLVAFAVIELAFPAMSVSSTLLTCQLSPVGEGEGMGMYTAVAAFAGLGGAVLGGWVAATTGYAATLWLAAVTIVAALALTLFLHTAPQPAAPSASTTTTR
jgi:MFS transporter, DHA1 family, tetracycline resistance protein